MIRFYSPILLLQLFCLYHAYTNRVEQKWYWLIVFFPFFGSLIYLYKTFYNRRNIDQVSEGVMQVFNTNYKIDKLEKEIAFSDTVRNKVQLADEHLSIGNFERAVELYKSCLTGIYNEDPAILKKLVRACYLNQDYESAIRYGDPLKGKSLFRNAEERVAYAWSHFYNDNQEEAEKNFKEMDARFTNYGQRLEYARFLNNIQKQEEGLEKLEELMKELDSMDRQERRFKKTVYREIVRYHRELSS